MPVLASLNPNAPPDDSSDIQTMLASLGPQAIPAVQALGKQAIASGAITPEEPQNNLNMQAPAAPQGPLSMGAPPQAYRKDVSSSSKKSEANSSTNTFLSPEQYQKLAEGVTSRPEYHAMTEADQNLQDQINATRATKDPGNFWVAPLLAYADSVNGSNLSQGYKEGLSKADLNAQLLKYEDEMAKRKQDQFKSLLSGVQGLKNGKENQININTSGSNDTSGVGGPGGAKANMEAFDKWNKAMASDPQVKQANSAIDAADTVSRLVDNPDNTSISQIAAQVALLRSSGLSRITNTELQNTTGQKDFSDRLAQSIETATSGKITPENAKAFKDAAADISRNAPVILATLRRMYEDQGAKGYGLTADQMRGTLDGRFSRMINPQAAMAPPPTAPGGASAAALARPKDAAPDAVLISNGKESHWVSPADIAEAQKEDPTFKVVK